MISIEPWEYGFYDGEDPNQTIFWSVFGLPHKTAESAQHTGSKNVRGQAVIVRRIAGSQAWEIATNPEEGGREMSGDNWAVFTRLDDEIEDLTAEVARLRAVIAEAAEECVFQFKWGDSGADVKFVYQVDMLEILDKATQTDKEGKPL